MDGETAVLCLQVFLLLFTVFWVAAGIYVLHISGDLKPTLKRVKDRAIQLSLLGVFLIPLGVAVLCVALG